MRRGLIACIVASGCGAPAGVVVPPSVTPTVPAKVHVAPEPAWSFDPQAYFDTRDFDASAFSRDVVVITGVPDHGSGGEVGVVGLDTKTGEELWRRKAHGWLLHPPHAVEPLYFAPAVELAPYSEGYTRLERLDAKTGAVLATIPLDRTPGLDFEVRIMWSARAALVIDDGSMTAFEWSTGKALWHTTAGDRAYLFDDLVRGDVAYLPGSPNLVVSLVDGAHLAEVPGVCCEFVASPDGTHVFARSNVDEFVELDPSLRAVQRVAGRVVAASDAYYAVLRKASLDVYAYGRAAPAWTMTMRDEHDFASAVALDRHDLFYFHDADATLWHVDLRDLAVEPVEKVGGHFVISTDVVGSSEPFLSTPPSIERPYLFLEDWAVRAFVIGDD